MGQAEPTTTSALLRRLALPAVFVGVVFYTQLVRQAPEGPEPSEVVSSEAAETPGSEPVTTELTGPTMGTTFTVKVRGPELSGEASETLSEAVTGALDAVNESMSTWLETSELSRFNAGPADTPFAFTAPTLEVLAISEAVYGASGGAFDVTVGPLVNRWGFGPEDPQGPPDAAEVSALLAAVGQDKLVIDAEAGTVSKPDAGLRVDLSAVAKGYAVDRVALALEALGYPSYMAEVGGEVRTGTPGDGAPWRIAVERPSRGVSLDQPAIFEVLELDRMAMATSGDYRNFIADGDTLRSHTIDPRTGVPVTHALASVTVVHEQCGAADAWATALMVLGPERGLEVADQQGLAAMFITRGEGELIRSATSEFALFSGPADASPAQKEAP
ncbi:MAG: FAD:protein FMN transferase [Deltaproteobacteria bacterium]|nr:FAD:protein FMN transferase [Deltaproteobacteria bacterium]